MLGGGRMWNMNFENIVWNGEYEDLEQFLPSLPIVAAEKALAFFIYGVRSFQILSS